jgi:hypothetical protein
MRQSGTSASGGSPERPVTVHWGGFHAPMNDPNNIDITNHFLAEAVGGGVVRLGLFWRSSGRASEGWGGRFVHRAAQSSRHRMARMDDGCGPALPLRLLLLRGLLRPDDLQLLLARLCDRRRHPGEGLVGRRSYAPLEAARPDGNWHDLTRSPS